MKFQVPALLMENGSTSGIPNSILFCVSYLYLTVVKRLQRDDWQVAMHFLQALLVEPRLILGVLAPGLCEFMFPSGVQRPVSIDECAEDQEMEEETIKKLARGYRDQLMYYHVMPYSERLPVQDRYRCRQADLADNESGCSR